MPVSEDQFAEQKYTWQGCVTGGFKGISLNADQVAVQVAFFLICSQPIDFVDYMYHLLTRRHESNGKNHNGKVRRECSWKHLIAIACASKYRSTLIPSHHHPITYTIITPLLVRLQQLILTSTKQLS